MLFNSWQFAIFMPVVFLLYYSLSANKRWVMLLLASYFFYMSWKIEYVFFILLSTCIAYFVANKMEENTLNSSGGGVFS